MRRDRWSSLGVLLPAAAALFAYWGSLSGGFVFDDSPSFLDNTSLSRGDWWGLAFGNEHTPLANRPFACWTLAINPSPAVSGSALRSAARSSATPMSS
jgi:hypothetical protein